MSGDLAPALWGIPVLADAASRDAAFPLATRSQDQRVFNKNTGAVERWSGSSWVVDLSNAAVSGAAIAAAIATANAYTDASIPAGLSVATLQAYLTNGLVKNVKHYGTTGTADDTSVFAAAIAASPAGAPVFVPDGTYIVRNVGLPAGTVLYANPGTATLKLKALAALDGAPILNVTGSNVMVLGLGFDGNKAAQAADGFADAYDTGPNSTGRAYRCAIKFKDDGSLRSGLTVDRCTFTSTYGAGVATNNVSKIRVTNSTFDLCNFEGVYIYSDFLGASFTKDHQVVGNRVTNGGSGDATTNSSAYVLSSAENFVVANNVAESVERAGLKMEYCRRGVVASNAFTTNSVLTFGGIEMQSATTSMLVVGNKIYNWSLGIILNPQAAQTATGVSIVGNVIETTTAASNGDGISVGNGLLVDLHIAGNNLTGVKRYGIGIQPSGTVRGLSIKSNSVVTQGTTSGAGIVLNVTGGNWRDVDVDDNTIDCGNAALAAAGIYIITGDSSTAAMVKITNNLVDVGTGHNGIRENAAIVTSGLCDGNLIDGALFLTSAGFRCGANNVLIAGAGNTVGAPGLSRTATATPVTVTPDDRTVYTNMSVASAVVVNLPQYHQIGQRITIKDSKGDANTNNITVTAFSGHAIDTTTTQVIRSNFGSLEIESVSATSWRIVSKFNPTAAALADLGALATTQTAGATYTSNEQTMLGNIKTDLASLRTEINTLLANRRAVGEQS